MDIVITVTAAEDLIDEVDGTGLTAEAFDDLSEAMLSMGFDDMRVEKAP